MAEAEVTTVARPYARAAFSCALDEDGGLATWSRMLLMLKAVISDAKVCDLLEDPLLTTEQQKQMIADLMGDDLSAKGANFVDVLAANDRLELMPTVSDMFEHLKANYEKTIDVEVHSAFDVSESEKDSLSEALKRKLQRDVNIKTTVDESLIGGVLIRADDMVIDDSVRGRLGRLSQILN